MLAGRIDSSEWLEEGDACTAREASPPKERMDPRRGNVGAQYAVEGYSNVRLRCQQKVPPCGISQHEEVPPRAKQSGNRSGGIMDDSVEMRQRDIFECERADDTSDLPQGHLAKANKTHFPE
ncbi:hypothetical protein KM043_010244 [Ampulex compressa]|nr:hypothetical protein KM043_010244 [Ampulex compressa]